MNKIRAFFVFLRRDLRLRADYFANFSFKFVRFAHWDGAKARRPLPLSLGVLTIVTMPVTLRR